jgi:hypothetical protein
MIQDLLGGRLELSPTHADLVPLALFLEIELGTALATYFDEIGLVS